MDACLHVYVYVIFCGVLGIRGFQAVCRASLTAILVNFAGFCFYLLVILVISTVFRLFRMLGILFWTVLISKFLPCGWATFNHSKFKKAAFRASDNLNYKALVKTCTTTMTQNITRTQLVLFQLLFADNHHAAERSGSAVPQAICGCSHSPGGLGRSRRARESLP